jgi:polyisoprenoid-binding protein YceI
MMRVLAHLFRRPLVKLAILLAPAVLLAAFALPLGAPSPAAPRALAPAAEAWAVDPTHSSLLFKVQHNGVSNFYGMFKEFGGRFTVDADASKCSVSFTVQAASIDSRNGKRDQHLSSPDFFSVKEFPTIEFKSTKIAKKDKEWTVTGPLTLHGVTKDITASVSETGKVTGDKGSVAGFETKFTIKRSDFGMDYGLEQGALGDEVAVVLAVEAHPEK